jgi:3-hydroxyisobutyrate dehydrogenase
MGSAFARRLLGARMKVSVWDPFPAAAARLSGAGAQVAASPEEAVRDAGITLTKVPTIASIEETMPQALAAMPRDAIWLQMSTIGVDGTGRAIALAKERRPDIVFVDAPSPVRRGPPRKGSF